MARGLPSTSLYRSQDEERLYLKSNIDGWFFDGFVNISQTHSLTTTQHPVQSGANITDHAYEDPIKITASIIVSDAYTADDTKRDAQLFLSNGATKSIGAFNVLRQMQSERRLLKVVTKYGTYKNMLLTSLTVNTGYKNLYNMLADIELEEIIIASEKTVKVSSRNQTTGTSSPDPSMNVQNDVQEAQAKAAVGEALNKSSNNSKSEIVKTTYKVPGDPIAQVEYSGSVEDLELVMNAVPSNADKKAMKTTSNNSNTSKKSSKTILGVSATANVKETNILKKVDNAVYSVVEKVWDLYKKSGDYKITLSGIKKATWN